jgi:hypothetical protein
MTPVSADFSKYRAHTFLFGAVCILILPLIAMMMWWLQDFPLGSVSFLAYFLAPFGLGMTISRIELATMKSPMVWCLPGQLQSARTLIARVGLVACAPILLCLSQREESLSALQLASVGFANLLFYCLGLMPRIFPPIASGYWTTLYLGGIGATWLSEGAAPVILAGSIFEAPIPVMMLSAIVCVFCWRRLGDRNRIHAFIQSESLSASSTVGASPEERQSAVVAAGATGWAGRMERRLLGWLFERVRRRATGSRNGSMLGVLLFAFDAEVLRNARSTAIVMIIVSFVVSLKSHPISVVVLHTMAVLPFVPMSLVVFVAWEELWRRRQAVLLLPTSRREILRFQWILLAAILGVGIYAVASQLAASLAVQAFLIESVDLESANRFRPWDWLNWFLLALAAPALAGLGFSLSSDDAISAQLACLVLVVAGAAVCVLVWIFYTLPQGWLQLCLALGIAAVWSWAIPVVRRQTLKKDVYA